MINGLISIVSGLFYKKIMKIAAIVHDELLVHNKVIFYIIITSCFIVALITQFSVHINHDVGSHIILSKRLMNGMEVIDPNPPLIFYLLMIPNYISSLVPVSEINIFRIMIFILLVISILLCNNILYNAYQISNNKLIIALLVFIFTLLPQGNFGQREHIFLLLIMPYIFLVAGRFYANKFNNFQSVFVGLLAGIGFSLKPYFLLLPIVLGVLSIYRSRKISFLKYNENIMIFAFVIVYTIFIFAFNRDYITKTVPIILSVYYAYNDSVFYLIFKLRSIIFILLIYYLIKDDKNYFMDILLLIILCMGLIFIIQGKGWSYQLYPFSAISLLFLIIAFPMILSKANLNGLVKVTSGSLIVIYFAILLFNSSVWYFDKLSKNESERERVEDKLIDLTKQYADGSNIYVFSTSVTPAFPVVNYSGVGWASRFNCLWMLPAIVENEELSVVPTTKKNKMSAIENYLFDSVLADLKAQSPEIIIVDNNSWKQALGKRKFDFIEFFSRNLYFKQFMSHYKELTTIDHYELFKRISANDHQ